jgi:AcrR family transcriptional regulator
VSRTTRDRVVDAAIELFNAQGVGAVTTNHIASHLGMSPGNLYYHYANKEEIIRAAFDRMNAEAEEVWAIDKGAKIDPTALQRMLAGNLSLFARYIFFARELPALLKADPILRERYVGITTRRIDQLEAVMSPLVDAGLLRDIGDREDLRTLVESAWMIGLFCIPYAETMDAATTPARSAKARAERVHAAVERGALLVIHMFKPYMDPLAYTTLVVLVRSELERLANKG